MVGNRVDRTNVTNVYVVGGSEVDDVGHAALPHGRFVAGFTQTGVGEVTVIGVRGTRRRLGLSRLSIKVR